MTSAEDVALKDARRWVKEVTSASFKRKEVRSPPRFSYVSIEEIAALILRERKVGAEALQDKCIEICQKYDDCGVSFIEEKIREIAL